MSETGAVSYWFVAGLRVGGGEPGFPFAGRLAFALWMQARRISISTHCTWLKTVSARDCRINVLNCYGVFGRDRGRKPRSLHLTHLSAPDVKALTEPDKIPHKAACPSYPSVVTHRWLTPAPESSSIFHTGGGSSRGTLSSIRWRLGKDYLSSRLPIQPVGQSYRKAGSVGNPSGPVPPIICPAFVPLLY